MAVSKYWNGMAAKFLHYERSYRRMKQTKWQGFVGTYTKGGSKGIYSFILDTETEEITNIRLAAELENPTYLTISRDNRFLYSVLKEGEKGGVIAFQIDKTTGGLTEINRELTPGTSPCHVSINDECSMLTSAYYHRGTVELYEINPDGSLSKRKSVVEHSGSGRIKNGRKNRTLTMRILHREELCCGGGFRH